MKCINPVLCYTQEKGKRKFVHFNLANGVILRRPHVTLNCGQCLICRKKRAYELAMRCVLSASMYDRNCFLTLTYDEKKPGYHNNFEYPDIQKFKKRLRQYVKRNHNGQKIEIYNVHEYGKNGKKHWHLIVLGWADDNREHYKRTSAGILSTSPVLDKLWTAGFSTHGDVSEASAMYQSQYVEKDFTNGNSQSGRKANSKHSGLGRKWFLKNYAQVLRLGYVPFQARKVPIPRYFEKIAKKHWCHFNEPSAFVDTKDRKRLYTPFKDGEASLDISKHYQDYKQQKQIHIAELEKEWNTILSTYIETKETPDFIKSGLNKAYDLKNQRKGTL